MKSLNYPKVTIILTMGFFLISGLFTDAVAMSVNVKNSLKCAISVDVKTSSTVNFGTEVGSQESYTFNIPPSFGTSLLSVEMNHTIPQRTNGGWSYSRYTAYSASGLGLTGETFTILLEVQGVTIKDKNGYTVHQGVWTRDPCP